MGSLAYLARRYTVSLLTPAAEVLTSLSSSPDRLTDAFDSRLSLFGMSAISYFRMRVLSASLTDHVPKVSCERPGGGSKLRLSCAQTQIVRVFEFWTVGLPLHDGISATGIEDQNAFRVCAKILPFGARRGRCVT